MKHLLLAMSILTMLAAAPARAASFKAAAIVHGAKASPVEITAARDLANDIKQVCGFAPEVVSEIKFKPSKGKAVFYIGTSSTNKKLAALLASGAFETKSAPGPEAFYIRSFPDKGIVAIIGGDTRGTIYGAYEFSRIALGIDPAEFWTGKEPASRAGLAIPQLDIRENPPAFPLRGYFDNDSDMLANWQGKKLVIEFETWKEMIDSLARMRYNFIDIFDTLGRAEFWNWPYYKKMAPDYNADPELIERIIDYAHSKGMMVQIPVAFGWEFRHLPYEKTCIAKYYGEWIDEVEYQLDKTPLGKGDIFVYSPRDIWWDRGYNCEEEKIAGVSATPLFSKFINEIHAMLLKHNPRAKLFTMLWSETQAEFRKGAYTPEKGIDFVWADKGYADYPGWPDKVDGHGFGIYIHAGFYLNHVVQDPLAQQIGDSTKEAAQRGMTAYYFVNGQSFKNFIFNLEAAARSSWSPESFDPEAFYSEWTERYFGKAASPPAIASMKELHAANAAAAGFTKLMDDTVNLLQRLRVGAVPDTDFSNLANALTHADAALDHAEKGAALVAPEQREVYDDQILYPARIYLECLRFHKLAADLAEALRSNADKSADAEMRKAARRDIKRLKSELTSQLERLIALLEQGSGMKKFEGWYKISHFRKITPPPSPEELKVILRTIN